MLYEQIKPELEKKVKKAKGSSMSTTLVRPFEIKYKDTQYPVLMVRIDNSGNRHYAIPNDNREDHPEAIRWIAERWVQEIIPV